MRVHHPVAGPERIGDGPYTSISAPEIRGTHFDIPLASLDFREVAHSTTTDLKILLGRTVDVANLAPCWRGEKALGMIAFVHVSQGCRISVISVEHWGQPVLSARSNGQGSARATRRRAAFHVLASAPVNNKARTTAVRSRRSGGQARRLKARAQAKRLPPPWL